jgi:hypothetical protein
MERTELSAVSQTASARSIAGRREGRQQIAILKHLVFRGRHLRRRGIANTFLKAQGLTSERPSSRTIASRTR